MPRLSQCKSLIRRLLSSPRCLLQQLYCLLQTCICLINRMFCSFLHSLRRSLSPRLAYSLIVCQCTHVMRPCPPQWESPPLTTQLTPTLPPRLHSLPPPQSMPTSLPSQHPTLPQAYPMLNHPPAPPLPSPSHAAPQAPMLIAPRLAFSIKHSRTALLAGPDSIARVTCCVPHGANGPSAATNANGNAARGL